MAVADGRINGCIEKLTFKDNGSVGGYIVKKIIETQERQMTYVFDGLKDQLHGKTEPPCRKL